MFITDVIYLDDTVTPSFRKEFTGLFHTSGNWGEGDLELTLSKKGVLSGSFTTEGITFGLKGTVSHTGVAFGYLLEPDAALPVALIRINASEKGLSLEVHVPEFTELLNESEPEKVLFQRVVTASALEEILVSK
jgi:hypothetical protein